MSSRRTAPEVAQILCKRSPEPKQSTGMIRPTDFVTADSYGE